MTFASSGVISVPFWQPVRNVSNPQTRTQTQSAPLLLFISLILIAHYLKSAQRKGAQAWCVRRRAPFLPHIMVHLRANLPTFSRPVGTTGRAGACTEPRKRE